MKTIIFLFGVVLVSMQLYAQPMDPAQNNKPALIDSSQHIANKIIKSKIPVLVDFWAVWCGPCRMLNPILKEIEKEYHGKVHFMKVNVDVHRSISSYFGVSAIPAVFIIKDRAVVKNLPGLRKKEDYAMALDEVLKMPPAGQSEKSANGSSKSTP